MPRVALPQLNLVFDLDDSKPLMFHLMDRGIPVASSCRGDGICGKCKMQVDSIDPLPPPTELETKTLAKNKASSGERLSCQIIVKSNMQLRTTYW